MPIRPELLLRDANRVPIPPREITERIQATWPGEGLDLRYLGVSWAVVRHWKADDRRWEWVRKEGYPREFAWDNIGSLPVTCSVDEAPAFLERVFREYPRDDIQKLALAVADWNALDQPKELAEAVVHATRDAMGSADEIKSAIYPVTVAKKSKRRPKPPDEP